MILRQAELADAEDIIGLWNPFIRDTAVTFNSIEKTVPGLQDDLRAKKAEGKPFLLAFEGEMLLGFATYGQFRAGVGYVHTMEHTIILHESAQGRGLGRALMYAIEQHARENGAHSMFAGVTAENPAGVAFHSALGYQERTILPQVGRKFGRWMDLVLMQKML